MIKVFIKRKVSETSVTEMLNLLKQLRSMTLSQPGYVSGETLKRLDRPDECMVISIWNSKDDWDNWLQNSDRISVQKEIDNLLGVATTYEVYG